LRKGSTAWYDIIFLNKSELTDLKLAERAESFFPDTGVRVKTPSNAEEDFGRLLGYMSDYLGITALIALFLVFIGNAFLFSTSVKKHVNEIAILSSLGSNRSQAFRVVLIKTFLIGFVAICVSMIFSPILASVLASQFGDQIPEGVSFTVSLKNILILILVTLWSLISVYVPVRKRYGKVAVSSIFGDEGIAGVTEEKNLKLTFFETLQVYSIFVIGFYFLSVYQSNSFKVGTYFFASMTGSLLFLIFAAFLFNSLFRKASSVFKGPLRLALLRLGNKKASFYAGFFSLSFCILLLMLIPQLKKSMEQEILFPEDNVLPELFLFDIQDEQLEDLKTVVTDFKTELSTLTPMVRSKLIEVNGEAFEKGSYQDKEFSREAQTERRFRNRGFNLTYRDKLQDSEEIIDGVPYGKEYDFDSDQPAELSLEHRFAKRLGLEIGDTLTFEVETIPFTGKVVNLRKIRWTSFQPNFFIQFQPGVLEEAPKTWLAAISDLDFENKQKIQLALAKKHPNISIIDVSRVVDRILIIVNRAESAIRIISLVVFLCGLFVLFSVVINHIQGRTKELNLMRVLGQDQGVITKSYLIEYFLLAGISSFFGFLLGTTITWILMKNMFDASLLIDTVWLIRLLGVIALVVVIFELISRLILYQQKSMKLLKI
jgi:putative ABC transport system permease protein